MCSGQFVVILAKLANAALWISLLPCFSSRLNGNFKNMDSKMTFYSSVVSILSRMLEVIAPSVSAMVWCNRLVASSLISLVRLPKIFGKNGSKASSKISDASPNTLIYSFIWNSFTWTLKSVNEFKNISIRSFSVISFAMNCLISSVALETVWVWLNLFKMAKRSFWNLRSNLFLVLSSLNPDWFSVLSWMVLPLIWLSLALYGERWEPRIPPSPGFLRLLTRALLLLI